MTSKTIVQSTHLFDPATKETFFVSVDSNDVPLITRIADSKETYISDIDEERLNSFMVVLPVFPVEDDIVISFDEDELVTGVIKYVFRGASDTYGIAFGDSEEIAVLDRCDFHVVSARPLALDVTFFDEDEDVVAIIDNIIGFPFGTVGTICTLYPEVGNMLVANPLGVKYVVSITDFRRVDHTDITFDFASTTVGEEDAPGIDISVEDAVHLGLMSEEEATDGVDADDVEEFDEAASEAASAFFENVFKAIFEHVAEDQRQQELDAIEDAINDEIQTSADYVSSANQEIDRKLRDAYLGISMQMNLLTRVMSSGAVNQHGLSALQAILTGMATTRNLIIDASKAATDRETENLVSAQSLELMAAKFEELAN